MEPIRQAAVIPIDDPTQVPVARRAAVEAGRRLGLSRADLANLEIVTTEIANNILQHAGTGGELFVSSNPAGTSVQIVAIDKGRGIASVERSLRDGFSTRETPGTGLGAVGRLGHELDIYSIPGQGAVVSAFVGPQGADARSLADDSSPSVSACSPPRPEIAVLSTALAGEIVNGDSWAVASTPTCDLYLMIDGLGHGLQASDAALAGVDVFRRSTHLSPAHIVEAMHAAMRDTRGAAALVLSVDPVARKVICCGVGNVSCVLQASDGRSQSLISHNGTVGHQMRRVQEFSYSFTPDTLLILHTDGLSTNWRFSTYPELLDHRPATVAGVLYRDAARRRDDATVLVSRLSGHIADPPRSHHPTAPWSQHG